MIKNITLNWPSIIEFGAGGIKKIKDYLKDVKKIFILSDIPIRERIEELENELKSLGFVIKVSFDVVPEPPIKVLKKLLDPVKEFSPDAIIGIGGGSTMDLAKLAAVLFSGEQKVEDIIGIGKVIDRKVKLITVSTTSGTGSEVTPIAVLTDVENKLKKGVVSKYLIPDVAIIDPEMTISLPSHITASTGMDAMTHCIEAYTNRYSHPIIDNIALEGIALIFKNLEKAVKEGDNIDARSAMALGSLYGGLCLGPVNTAAVHAMAYPLGGEFKIPHGVANSVLLPYVMNFNLPNCIEKYSNIAEVIGVKGISSSEDIAKEAILRIKKLSDNCGIPTGLKALKIPEESIPSMAESALLVKRLMENNPRVINLDQAKDIFQKAYEEII